MVLLNTPTLADSDFVWRDYEIEDDPSSPPHKPIKSEIRYLFNDIAQRLAGIDTTVAGQNDAIAAQNDRIDTVESIVATQGERMDDIEAMGQEVFLARDEAEAAAEQTAADVLLVEEGVQQAQAAQAGAAAERIRAETAADTAVALLDGRLYPTVAEGLASTSLEFAVQGPAPDSGPIIYRDVAGVAQQIGAMAGSGEVAALTLRVEAVEPFLTVFTTYLDPEPQYKPRFLYADSSFDDYDDITNPSAPVHVSPETLRLDIVERAALVLTDVSPGYKGRVTFSDDWTVIEGQRVLDDFHQKGPAPEVDLGAYRRGADGAGSIWVAGNGVAPFCISNEFPGDNVALRHHGFEGVDWINIPPTGLPTRKWFSFLGGVEAGALVGGVTTLILLLETGQSTSNGTGSIPILTATCPKTGNLLMYDVTSHWPNAGTRGVRVLGHGQSPEKLVEPLDITKTRLLIPAHESQEGGNGETQLGQCGYELQKRLGDTFAIVEANTGIGSVGYNNVKKGTVIYENGLKVMRQTYAIAKQLNLAFMVVVVWPEHEASVTDTQAQFLAKLVEFQNDISADAAAITNGEVTNVLFITNAFNNGTAYNHEFTEEGLAQLQFAVENPDKSVCATTTSVLDRKTDKIHFTNVAGARNGSYMGRAAGNKLLGRDALPLYTMSVAVTATDEITGDMHLPYDANALTIVSPWVTDPGLLGFKLVREDNQVEVPIDTATLVSANQWRVKASARPTGIPLEVSHGFRGIPGNAGGPTTSARCPINDGASSLDFFGSVFPNHLCPQRFSITF